MFVRRLYYTFKPYIPWRLRIAMRRVLARRQRRANQDVWPILESAARSPAGWPGWPEGRQFTFVLSHDVEGPAGLARCRQLMQLEMELGFRSCFNFVPDGDYAVTRELREELVQNGFEVGVHDLHHDGKLYESRQAFSENAAQINHYLKEWDAVGFRSAFMLHELDWLHELNVQYDASTFDTDPFEPQSDGAGTIFPFLVPQPNSDLRSTLQPSPSSLVPGYSSPAGGYIELPYTLPQDSTLFLILCEMTPMIWLRKLDWIAQHGGMALVNVHPDYLQFSGETSSPSTFPLEHYVQLLKRVRDHYQGACWHALPREVAAYARSLKTLPAFRKSRQVGIVSYSIYETDTRVFRYGKALAERGDQVDAFVLAGSSKRSVASIIDGVCVHRIQTRVGNTEQTKFSYLWPLLRFLAAAGWRLSRRHARRPYDLIHVHNVPDFLVFAALRPKLEGARVILDIHDLVPEFFGSKFGMDADSLTVRLLKVMEKVSARFADHVIVANDLWLGKYSARASTPSKCSVMINYVDRQIFFPRPRIRKDDRLILLFPGGLQRHQGVDLAIRAFNQVKDRLPQAEFHIYGAGNAKPELIRLVQELRLEDRVRFRGLVDTTEIAAIMAEADLGVVPKRADSFGNEAYSTKIMEFMSLGVPVVASATKIDRFYFNDSVLRFFDSGNVEALAEAIVDVLQNRELRRRLVSNALEFAEQNNWQHRQGDYLKLVDDLVENRRTPGGQSRPGVWSDVNDNRNGRSVPVASSADPLTVR